MRSRRRLDALLDSTTQVQHELSKEGRMDRTNFIYICAALILACAAWLGLRALKRQQRRRRRRANKGERINITGE